MKSKNDNPTVWVLVETVSQHRMRYMVETPADHPEYALDTVTMEEAREFSQEWLGETILSHRVVSQEDALALCREDNDYVHWDDQQVMNAHFTPAPPGELEEQHKEKPQ